MQHFKWERKVFGLKELIIEIWKVAVTKQTSNQEMKTQFEINANTKFEYKVCELSK